jgi:hypothetical protein
MKFIVIELYYFYYSSQTWYIEYLKNPRLTLVAPYLGPPGPSVSKQRVYNNTVVINSIMKSPLYILTVLLPLALAIPAAEPDVGAESIEERDNRNDNNKQTDRCRKNSQIWYYRYPCDSSDRLGSYRNNQHVDYICKYKGWYKTGNSWWVKGSDKPSNCNSGNRNCF